MQRYAILKGRVGTSTAGPFESHALEGLAPRMFSPRVEIADLKAQEVIDEARDPDTAAIARVMPTKLIKPLDVPGMPAATHTWGIDAVGAGASAFTGNNVVVAVLDTGIDKSHPAFQGITIVEKDFSGSGNGDVQGHGTHCAGTIFGRDVNGTRIGVARGVKRALIGKVLGDNGSGGSDMIFNGIQWAVQEGANVISMSLGFDFPGLVDELVQQHGLPIDLATSIALEGYRGNLRMFDALMAMVKANAAFTEGTVLVAAAGNESRRNVNPDFEIGASIPAAAEGVVSVAALEQGNGQGMGVAFFSNTFAQISGPGVNILSAKAGGGLRALNGTSMACPHVAGVTALWWEAVRQSAVRPSAAVVINKMMAAARTTGFSPGVDPVDRGVGIVTSP